MYPGQGRGRLQQLLKVATLPTPGGRLLQEFHGPLDVTRRGGEQATDQRGVSPDSQPHAVVGRHCGRPLRQSRPGSGEPVQVQQVRGGILVQVRVAVKVRQLG
jgi:hypothetical protein